MVVRNAAGVEVGFCTSGTDCVTYSNPDAGTTQTFTAELRTQRNGQTAVIDTAGPVTVTDPGWQGSFSYAYADNPTPALSASTAVRFGFTQALSGASVTVTDDAGRFVRTCSSGTECLVAANPAAGMTASYTARLYVQLAGSMVEREAHTVSVTDPGWQGTIMPAATNDMFVEAGKSTTVSFDLSTPLEAASVEILVDGTYQRTCGPNSSPSVCGVNASFSAAPVHTVKAVLTAQRAGGWQEIGSVMTYVTTFTEEQFTQWLLDPATDLSVLENPALVSALLAVRAQPLTLAYCVAVGEKVPTHSAEGTPTDTTLGCTGGALTMRQILASAIATLGLVAGVYVLSEATAATEAPTATPLPIPPPLPPVPGQDTTGGGGTADNTPDADSTTSCQQLDSAGTCIDGQEPEPQPQPQPPSGGDNEPPAVAVDTCQLPPGPDPDVFYFYQRDYQRALIEQNAFVRSVGDQGKIWLASVLYPTAAEAQAELSIPNAPPDGYYEVPMDRLEDLYGPSCVQPDFGQPGGGYEYWTTQDVNMEGLTWHPMN